MIWECKCCWKNGWVFSLSKPQLFSGKTINRIRKKIGKWEFFSLVQWYVCFTKYKYTRHNAENNEGLINYFFYTIGNISGIHLTFFCESHMPYQGISITRGLTLVNGSSNKGTYIQYSSNYMWKYLNWEQASPEFSQKVQWLLRNPDSYRESKDILCVS